MADGLNYHDFREEVLAGCDWSGETRDTPTLRATAACDYFDRHAAAAADAEESAQAALRKAQDQVEAAREAITAAQATRQTADQQAELGRQLAADSDFLNGRGPDKQVSAGLARGTGEARL